jgi:hypothetical protein
MPRIVIHLLELALETSKDHNSRVEANPRR